MTSYHVERDPTSDIDACKDASQRNASERFQISEYRKEYAMIRRSALALGGKQGGTQPSARYRSELSLATILEDAQKASVRKTR